MVLNWQILLDKKELSFLVCLFFQLFGIEHILGDPCCKDLNWFWFWVVLLDSTYIGSIG